MHVEKINSIAFRWWNITLRITRSLDFAQLLTFQIQYQVPGTGSVPILTERTQKYLHSWIWQEDLFSVTGHVSSPEMLCSILNAILNEQINIQLLTSPHDIFKYDLQNTETMCFFTSWKCYKPHWSFTSGVTTTKCPCRTSCNKQTNNLVHSLS